MSAAAAKAKWDRRYQDLRVSDPEPAHVLAENAHLLPAGGEALDLACGLGGNALFLARRGFNVAAWDISSVAIEWLASLAGQERLQLQAQTLDVDATPFPCAAFDVVVVSRFLSRPLAGPIMRSLRPGGLLFYQTYVRDKPEGLGPSKLDYLLETNELLRLFGTLRLLVYREEGRVGDLAKGLRSEAYLVGMKC